MEELDYIHMVQMYVEAFEEIENTSISSYALECAENAVIYPKNYPLICKYTSHPKEYLEHYEANVLGEWLKLSSISLDEAKAFWGIYRDIVDSLSNNLSRR